MSIRGEAVQAAMAVLCDMGADSGGWHSWRCFDRELYPEPCDCTERVARAAIAATEPHIRAKAWDEALTEARDLGWLHDDAHADVVARNPYRQEQP